MYKNTILAVDDDTPFCGFLKLSLEKEGFQVVTTTSTEDAKKVIQSEPVDLLLLDVMVPSTGGIEFCRWIREDSDKRDLPILMMSVLKSEDDKVKGLDAGADDYLGKPFHGSILAAHARAVLRRSGHLDSTLSAGDVTIDLEARKVSVKEFEIKLSPKEFDLLTAFLQHKRKLLTRHFLCDQIWGLNHTDRSDQVDKYIKLLRTKLGPSGDGIQTVWGLGYRFVPKNEYE